MKTTYISYISLLLLLVLLLPTGCSKDETEEGILTNKPGENGVVCLSHDATILLEQEDLNDLVPSQSAIFYLLPCKPANIGRASKEADSAPLDFSRYLLINGEKDDDGNFYLDFPAGTECIPYIIVRSVDGKGREVRKLGLKVILSDDGVLYTDDTYDWDYELFGEGTAEAPYRISQLLDLKDISLVRGKDNRPVSHAGKYFRLEADIMCNDGINLPLKREEGGISPIGMSAVTTNIVITPFLGNFDGNNHYISDLSLRSVGISNNLGLFAAIADGAVIRNLKLYNMVISSANENIGGLVGVMRGDAAISNCHVNVNLTGCRSVGALVGRMESGTITECSSTGQVSVNKTSSAATYAFGGIVGNLQPASGASITIDNVENVTTLDATENVGGIVGFIGDTGGGVHTLKDVKSTANNITGLRSVGGLVGGCSGGLKIENGYSSTRLSAPVDGLKKDCGGLVGAVSTRSSFTLTNCEVESPVGNEVSIISGFHVGGLVGYAGALGGTLIENCRSAFSVMTVPVADASSEKYVGGLVGRANSQITFNNSECTAKIVMSSDTTKSGAYVGGLVGRADDRVTITGCTNSATIRAMEYAGGLVGSTEDVTITKSANQADVTATSAHAGGLVGYSRHCDISNITLLNETEGDGAATISSGWRAGGIIGLVGDGGGSITGCTTGGHVNDPGGSQNSKCAGGIIGEIFSSPGMKVENVTYKGTVAGGQYTGGIIGYSNGGTFVSCTTSSRDGKILATKSGYAGGIAGLAEYSSFSKCINGTIVDINKGGGNHGIGGIVGYVGKQGDKKISECTNTASVTGNNQTGGITGGNISNDALDLQIQYSHNSGNITGTDEVGGISGSFSKGRIYRCSNRGEIMANGHTAGGISGCIYGTESFYSRGYVDQCFNIGTIVSKKNVGGIVGKFFGWSYARIHNSYNRAQVGYDGSSNCAGIVGYIDNNTYGELYHCYSGGTARTGWGIFGRIFAETPAECSWIRCHYSKESAPDDGHKTPDYTRNTNGGLSDRTNFNKWDFGGIWVMKSQPELIHNRETNN